MKHHRYRLLLAGVLALATVSLPLSVPFAESLIGAGTAAAVSSSLSNPDVITYTQASTGTTVTYAPYGGTATVQTLTPKGPCGTPTVTPAATPILGMSGLLYPPGASGYSGTPSTVPVGSYRQQTGVCGFPPSWQIGNFSPFGEEGLDFTTVGTNTLDQTPGCTANCGRTFLDAQISLERESWPWWPSSIPVQLVEYLGGQQVGSVTCTITGPVGTVITADTDGNSVCTGSAPLTGFDTVEIELPEGFTSASVVGTSTFTLAPQVCGGESISTPAGSAATATLQNNSSGGCESFTGFSSNAAGNSLTYNEYSGGTPQPFTVTIQWAPVADCQPTPDTAPQYDNFSLPVCPVTQFVVNGTTYYDQTFCSSPTSTPAPLCTQNKDYNYKSVNGVDETFITEVWVGNIDWSIRI
jgi:hypothetical protein